MKEILQQLTALKPLSEETTMRAFEMMMTTGDGAATDAQIGAYLFGTACRPLSVDELVGAARTLRGCMSAVPAANRDLLDTCGTGGSGLQGFNTSTASAIVCAAAGQPVAKHGNRASTSRSGSADVLEALGVNVNLAPDAIARCLEKTGFCFMFAPHHHPAAKRAAMLRREVGFRTIFNFLGPLCNPAGARFQVLGVSSAAAAPVIAEALCRLGQERALVVRGEDGLDELTLSGTTAVYEVKGGGVSEYAVSPEDFGLTRAPVESIAVSSPQDSAEKLKRVLAGEPSAYRELVILNAGAALYICGAAASINEGAARAAKCIDSGSAAEKLAEIAACTNGA